MKIRVFYPNKDNKMEFTKQQLEKLLDEVYEEGRAKGYDQGYAAGRPITITYPYTPYWYTTTNIPPYITCKDDITLNTTDLNTLSSKDYSILSATTDNIVNSISIGDEK